MTREIKLGLIGAGGSISMYCPGLRHLPNVKIAAVADPSPDARKRASETFAGTSLYDSAEAMLTGQKLDGVIVASPPWLHVEHVAAVARTGTAVLAEKPMARTVAEAEAMTRACSEADVLFMVGFNRRYLSPLWTATQMIRAGELGEVFATECNWTSYTIMSHGWRDEARCMGGVFQDHGSHSIDLAAQWLGSAPQTVSANAQRIAPKVGNIRRSVEDHMSALFTHANGASSLHIHSRACHRPVSELYRIYGTKATLELEYTGDWSYLAPDNWGMRLYREGWPLPRQLVSRRANNELLGELSDGAYGYFAELKLFVDAIREGRKTCSPTGDEAVTVVKAVSAAFLSAAREETVNIQQAEEFDAKVFAGIFR